MCFRFFLASLTIEEQEKPKCTFKIIILSLFIIVGLSIGSIIVIIMEKPSAASRKIDDNKKNHTGM